MRSVEIHVYPHGLYGKGNLDFHQKYDEGSTPAPLDKAFSTSPATLLVTPSLT